MALKVLRHDGADPHARERLIREARVAASVVHPLICQVYALGTHGSSPFIVMELMEGESLAERLARGPVPATEALRLAITTFAPSRAARRPIAELIPVPAVLRVNSPAEEQPTRAPG